MLSSGHPRASARNLPPAGMLSPSPPGGSALPLLHTMTCVLSCNLPNSPPPLCPSLCFLCFDVLTAPAPSRYTHTTFLTYWFIACLLQQNVRWTRTSILFILIALASAAGRMPNSEQSHNEYLLNGFKEWVVEIISITFRRIQCYGLLRQKCHRSSYHVHRTNVVTLA